MVRVHEARSLCSGKGADSTNFPDPLVRVSVVNKQFNRSAPEQYTTAKEKTAACAWEEDLYIDLPALKLEEFESSGILLTVLDKSGILR